MVRNELFESPHIGRMFLRIAVPGSIGMLASAIYQFIDGIFVNNFLGSAAFAAVNFSFPFLIAAYAVSDLFGVGSSVVLSLKLGQKKGEEANRIFTATVIRAVVMSDAPPVKRSITTYCMEPAKTNMLMAIAHKKLYPLVSIISPNPRPSTTYPAITGSESKKACLKVLFRSNAFSFLVAVSVISYRSFHNSKLSYNRLILPYLLIHCKTSVNMC